MRLNINDQKQLEILKNNGEVICSADIGAPDENVTFYMDIPNPYKNITETEIPYEEIIKCLKTHGKDVFIITRVIRYLKNLFGEENLYIEEMTEKGEILSLEVSIKYDAVAKIMGLPGATLRELLGPEEASFIPDNLLHKYFNSLSISDIRYLSRYLWERKTKLQPNDTTTAWAINELTARAMDLKLNLY